MESLREWLSRQMRLRGWSARELSRQANISDASVLRALGTTKRSKDSPASWDVLYQIAKALRTDPSAIFRRAGLMEREPPQVTHERELLNMFRQLPVEHQNHMLFFAEYLFTQRARLFPLFVEKGDGTSLPIIVDEEEEE